MRLEGTRQRLRDSTPSHRASRARDRRDGGRCRARAGRFWQGAWACGQSRNRVGRRRLLQMVQIRYRPGGIPEASTFEESFATLSTEAYRACEIVFVSGFWLDYVTAPP